MNTINERNRSMASPWGIAARICSSCGLMVLAAAMIAAGPAVAQPPATTVRFAEVPATLKTIRDLRDGGFTLFLRHGPTDTSRPDRVPQVDLADCSTQRPLTDDGRAMIAKVGEHLRRFTIPIGTVHVSPLCRAKESAALAFPGHDSIIVDPNLIYTANMTAAQKRPILAETRRLLSTPVSPGSNLLVLAHGPNLMDLIGYFPKEATLVIFRPKGNDAMDYVASIPASRWLELAQ